MKNPFQNLSFTTHGNHKSEMVATRRSYAIHQFLIAEQGSKLVRAVLFVIDVCGEDHDYNSLSCFARNLGDSLYPIFDGLDDYMQLETEQTLIDEGTSISSRQFLHCNTLFVPKTSHTSGTLPKSFPNMEDWDDEIEWSLHIV